jgi:hypothetical protein
MVRGLRGAEGRRRLGAAVVAALFAGAAPGRAAAQCAMCSTAVGSSASVARGFAISILFLLSTVFLVTLAFVILVFRRARPAGARVAPAIRSALRLAGIRWRLPLRPSAPSPPSS